MMWRDNTPFGVLALIWFLLAAFLFMVLLWIDGKNRILTRQSEVLHTVVLDSKQTIKYMDEYDFYIYSVDGEVRFTAKTLEELLDQIGETER